MVVVGKGIECMMPELLLLLITMVSFEIGGINGSNEMRMRLGPGIMHCTLVGMTHKGIRLGPGIMHCTLVDMTHKRIRLGPGITHCTLVGMTH